MTAREAVFIAIGPPAMLLVALWQNGILDAIAGALT